MGAIAQLGERLLCKQEVVGSIPSGSTNLRRFAASVGKPTLTQGSSGNSGHRRRRLPAVASAKAGGNSNTRAHQHSSMHRICIASVFDRAVQVV